MDSFVAGVGLVMLGLFGCLALGFIAGCVRLWSQNRREAALTWTCPTCHAQRRLPEHGPRAKMLIEQHEATHRLEAP